jgi:hypothetical protein
MVKLTLEPGRAAQLVCPASECPHKPRETWATLVALADQAVARDRLHSYV